MLVDDILYIEHIHEIAVTDAFRVNQYYHVIGHDKNSNPVELWLFTDDLLDKADVRHVMPEYLTLFGIQYDDIQDITIINNHVLCIRLSVGTVYHNDQILNTMGDILQFTVSDVYRKQLES